MADDFPQRFAAALSSLKYARGDGVHPDYQPDGIAPRIGHALKRLAAEGDGVSAAPHAHLAQGVLATGDHGLLPILADALEEHGHEALGWFDWRHAPRAIAIDRALAAEIGRHQVQGRQFGGVRGPRRALSPGWMVADWREKVRGRVSRNRAHAVATSAVFDANRDDVLHSAIRLMDIQHGLMPHLVDDPVRWGEAHAAEHNATVSKLPAEMRPHTVELDNGVLKQLGATPRPDGQPHNVYAYPDTRR